MTMTLERLLDDTPNGTPLKIGANTCFIYCYYNDSHTKERLIKEDNKYIQELQRRLLKKTSEYYDLDDKLKRNKGKIRRSKRPKENKEKEIKALEKRVEKARDTLPKSIENLKKKINAYVPILNRQVVDTYKLNMPVYENPNTLYIWIKGNEKGDYTDINDYARAKQLPIKKGDDKWTEILKARYNQPKPKRKKVRKLRKL